jgi:prolyl oligopeptidase
MAIQKIPPTFECSTDTPLFQNIRKGVSYPPTLVLTAEGDNRVVPSHSYKFAATLQEAQAGDAPILIRIDTKAGHGGGKPVGKQADELTDMCAFAFAQMGDRAQP